MDQFNAAKRIVRYLAGTKELGLQYTQEDEDGLETYSDSDWGGFTVDLKSTIEIVVLLGFNPNFIELEEARDHCIFSTAEADYIAVTTTACQIVWLNRILQDYGREIAEQTKLWCDNQSAIAVTKNLAHHWRTKHIDVRFLFI